MTITVCAGPVAVNGMVTDGLGCVGLAIIWEGGTVHDDGNNVLLIFERAAVDHQLSYSGVIIPVAFSACPYWRHERSLRPHTACGAVDQIVRAPLPSFGCSCFFGIGMGICLSIIVMTLIGLGLIASANMAENLSRRGISVAASY